MCYCFHLLKFLCLFSMQFILSAGGVLHRGSFVKQCFPFHACFVLLTLFILNLTLQLLNTKLRVYSTVTTSGIMGGYVLWDAILNHTTGNHHANTRSYPRLYTASWQANVPSISTRKHGYVMIEYNLMSHGHSVHNEHISTTP